MVFFTHVYGALILASFGGPDLENPYYLGLCTGI